LAAFIGASKTSFALYELAQLYVVRPEVIPSFAGMSLFASGIATDITTDIPAAPNLRP